MPDVAEQSKESASIGVWSIMATEAMFRPVEGSVRFAVLERIMATASDIVKVVPLKEGDPMGRERVQMVPKAAVGRDDIEMVDVSADLAEAEHRHEEVEGEPVDAPVQSGQPAGSRIEAKASPPPEAATDAKPQDDPLELPDYISHIEIVMGTGKPMPSLQTCLFVRDLDRLLFDRPNSDFLKREYAEVGQYSSQLLCLAKALYDNLGDEVLDIALALVMYSERERGDQTAKLLEGKELQFLSQNNDKKRQLLGMLLGQYKGIEEDDLRKSVEWALGKNIFERLSKGSPQLKDVLEKFKKVFLAKSIIWTKLLRAFERSTLASDKALAASFTRQGWTTLIRRSRVVSDWEWFDMLRKQTVALEAQPEIMAQVADTPSRKARFEQGKRDVADFFAANPDKPAEGDVQKLFYAIGCDDLRKQLRKVDKEHNPFAYGALQHEIASKIVRYVSRYRKAPSSDNGEDETPSWEGGFPTHVVKSKEATCFSGPWLIAMLLIASGINEEDILYCNVNQGFDGTIGGHGSIILKTKVGELLLFDHGFSLPGTNMKAIPLRSRSMHEKFGQLLGGKTQEPVLLEVADEGAARHLQIHRSMQVMPISAGFNSGHMLHVGNSFLVEGKLDEAEYAFELGLTYSPRDPDLLYGIAVVNMRKGYEDEARIYCEEALGIFPKHLWSCYLLVDIYMLNGEPEDLAKAKEYLKIIAEEKGRLYNGKRIQENAKRLVALDGEELKWGWAAVKEAA